MATYDQFAQFFRDTDADNSGYVDTDELIKKLKSCGYKGGDANIKRMFAETDTSGDGLIAFDEYMIAMGFTLTLKDKGEAMRRIFYEMDTKNTGRIHITQIEEVLEQLKRHFFRSDLKRIREVAMQMKDKDGYIVTEDFLKRLMQMKIIIIESLEVTGGRFSIEKRKNEVTTVTETTTTTTTTRRKNLEEQIDEIAVNGQVNGDAPEYKVSEPCIQKMTETIVPASAEANNNKQGKVSVMYTMHYWPEDDNRTLGVLGNIPELGQWDPSKALLAQQHGNTGWWTVTFNVLPKTRFEWKWVVLAKDWPEVLRWEIEQGGNNREAQPGTSEGLWYPWKDWATTV